jgi:DUF1680 family protein
VVGEETPVTGGTARVHRAFASGDEVVLELDVAPRFTVAAPGIDAVRGTIAVERGPLVLCLESPDLPDDVRFEDVRLDPSNAPRATGRGAAVDLLIEKRVADDGWPYRRLDDGAPASGRRRVSAELVPYASWANRGPGLMRVWIPAAG